LRDFRGGSDVNLTRCKVNRNKKEQTKWKWPNGFLNFDKREWVSLPAILLAWFDDFLLQILAEGEEQGIYRVIVILYISIYYSLYKCIPIRLYPCALSLRGGNSGIIPKTRPSSFSKVTLHVVNEHLRFFQPSSHVCGCDSRTHWSLTIKCICIIHL